MAAIEQTGDDGGLFRGPARYVPVSPWHPLGAAFVTAVASGAGVVVGIVAVVALMLHAGDPTTEVDETFSLATLSGAGLAALGQIASLAVIWLAAGYRSMRSEVLQLARPSPGIGTLALAGLLLVAISGVLEGLMYLTTRFDIMTDTEWLREGLVSPYWWATVLIAVVLAPLWEELAFRGFLLSALAKTGLGFWGGGIVSNVLWTLLHWGYSWQGMVSVFVSGLVLTWLIWRTGSIKTAIVAHAIANTAALIFAYVISGGTAA